MEWTGKRIDSDNIPSRMVDTEDVYKIMCEAIHSGASDIIFQTGRPVMAAIYGELFALTPYWLQPTQLKRLATSITNLDSIGAKLNAGDDFDTALSIDDPFKKDDYNKRIQYRFRINITANEYASGQGMQIVCRYIPATPPTIHDIALEEEIIKFSTPEQGAVLIAGETGSGKTTTFAGLVRYILENDTPIKGNILTYESPIEFVYEDIASSHCIISQQEIGKHIPSFAAGIRNSLRRKPSLIVVGELRDIESVMAAVEAANTGHPIYSTVHANSAAHIIRRMTNLFSPEQQTQAFHDILTTTQLLISQLLVPKVGGGRICLREWLVIDEAIRQEILKYPIEQNNSIMRKLIEKNSNARSMDKTVRIFLKKGLISSETANKVLYRYGYHGLLKE
jgi:Tfp pilus assembly protein, pilus retraction ATPase PilT